MIEPARDRPRMPDGYGVPETDQGMLDWEAVEERLVASEQYWMATARPDGRPHVIPRWGVWIDGGLFYTVYPVKEGWTATGCAVGAVEVAHGAVDVGDGAVVVVVSGWGSTTETVSFAKAR